MSSSVTTTSRTTTARGPSGAVWSTFRSRGATEPTAWARSEQRRDPLEQVGDDASRGTPDQVFADRVAVGEDRDAATDESTSLVTVTQVVQRQLEHLRHLTRAQSPGHSGLDEADIGIDGVSGDDRGRGREGADDLDSVWRQSDLFLGLPERGGLKVWLALILSAARERHLSGVTAEVLAPLGEDSPELARVEVQRDEDRGIGSAVHVEPERVLGREQELAQRVSQLPVLHWHRPTIFGRRWMG